MIQKIIKKRGKRSGRKDEKVNKNGTNDVLVYHDVPSAGGCICDWSIGKR